MASAEKAPSSATAMATATARQALFEEKHRELLSDAAGVSTEFGVNVSTLAFYPGDAGAVVHQFRGRGAATVAGPQASEETIRQLVGKDVSSMGLAEVTEHEAQLRTLRAALVRKLQEKRLAAAAGGEMRRPEPEEKPPGNKNN